MTEEQKPTPRRTNRKTPPEGQADRPAAPRAPRARKTSTEEPASPPEATEEATSEAPAKKKRGPYNVAYSVKKPASYRLPPDVLELIMWATQDAKSRGDRLTKDEVITQAVRSYWGRKKRR